MQTSEKEVVQQLKANDLPNPFDDTYMHEHVCRNCSVKWHCTDPLCDGGCCDPELCPDCREALNGIW